jgi:hypothetical protein
MNHHASHRRLMLISDDNGPSLLELAMSVYDIGFLFGFLPLPEQRESTFRAKPEFSSAAMQLTLRNPKRP